MSEQQTAEATATESEATNTEQSETKPTETVDFWKQKAREQEKRAKENADAAKRLAEIEEAQKSEADKATERLTKAEQRAAEAEARVLRREVALDPAGDGSLAPLSKEHADLLDALTDEDAMRRIAGALATASEDKRKNGNRVPREGHTSSTKSDPKREFLQGLTGSD
jgi:hypothetical protein